MTPDRRNTVVVVALILSLTIGVRVLLWLEPGKPHWNVDPLLAAERPTPTQIQDVTVIYAATADDAATLLADRQADGACLVWADAQPEWYSGGPHVQVIVVGSETNSLSLQQQKDLLATLGSLSQASGRTSVPVQLAPWSDARQTPGLPKPAEDLCNLLVRKKLID